VHINLKMLRAATEQAIELGVLPRRSQMEDLAANIELMQEILKATLENSAAKDEHD
jgi:hypothetical protein